MRHLGWVVLVVMLIAAVAGTLLYAQGGGGGGGGRGGGPGAGYGAMELERMKMALEGLGMSREELAVAEKAVEAKFKARQSLQDELGKLREVAEDSQATEQQLTAAVEAYTKAMGRYRTAVQSEDNALAKKLSARSHARSLAAGVLDNGLGGQMRRRGGAGGAGGAGGGGGRGSRGGEGGGGAPPPPRD